MQNVSSLFRRPLSSRGYSFIELLAGLAVLSVVGLAFGKMMSDNMAMSSYIEDRMSAQQFFNELKLLTRTHPKNVD